jgi:hypothetical protein
MVGGFSPERWAGSARNGGRLRSGKGGRHQPGTVGDIDRISQLTVEGIDRMYLNVYVPGLQYEHGIIQENTPVFRTERRRNPKTGRSYRGSCGAARW